MPMPLPITDPDGVSAKIRPISENPRSVFFLKSLSGCLCVLCVLCGKIAFRLQGGESFGCPALNRLAVAVPF
jgi:hypothetical protein